MPGMRRVMGREVTLGEKLTMKTPQGQLTQEGVDAVLAYLTDVVRIGQLREIKAGMDRYSHLMEAAFPGDWEWQWKVDGKAKYVGTLTKRLSKYCHHMWGVDLTPEQLQAIGGIAKAHTLDNLTFVFEFSDDFHWKQGCFGDTNWKSGTDSCLWGEKKSARYIMENEGGLAIRFYQDATDAYSGYARAFLAPDLPGEGSAVLWNGYGFKGNSTLIIARTLALWAGLSYKKITLTCNGRGAGSALNINQDIGYALAPAQALAELSAYDLEWGKKRCACAKCKKVYSSVSRLVIHERLPAVHELRCGDCLPKTCSGCSVAYDDLDYQEIRHTWYCPDCVAKYWQRCADCQQFERKNSTEQGPDGRLLCTRCYDKRYLACNGCQDTIERPSAVVMGHYVLCQTCKDIYTTCDHCTALLHRAQTTEHGGKRYCKSCASNLKTCLACGAKDFYSPFSKPLCSSCRKAQAPQVQTVSANSFYAAITAAKIVIVDEANNAPRYQANLQELANAEQEEEE